MKSRINTICLWVGVALLVVAAVGLIFWYWGIHDAQQKAEGYVQAIYARIPQPQGAAVEARRDNTMSVLSVEGTDFVGILEMPRFDSTLPVCAGWGEVEKYPCRLGGSAYDRTIQIGATSQKGQYDFYREISAGDTVFFTDMEGNRFCYEVTDIRYESHADQETLQRKDAALTLFIKNVYALEYIVIFCDVANG